MAKYKIDSRWFRGKPTQEEKEARLKSVLASASILEVLGSIVDTKITSKARVSEETYESGNWAYKEADRQGYLRACYELKDLLTIKEDNS